MSALNDILQKLASMSNKKYIESMARFGINSVDAYGIRIPALRAIAKDYKNDHILAEGLWKSRKHEAMILASMVEDPKMLTSTQMDEWVLDFQSWDLCDEVCANLFVRNDIFREKVEIYSQRPEEFVKRTGFVLMATHATKIKQEKDEVFLKYFDIIEKEANDERNFVKKGVNWALRQIGKRNLNLCHMALESAERIRLQDSRSARWIANDAIRELKIKIKTMRE